MNSMKSDIDQTCVHGLFDRVSQEFNKLVEESGEDYPCGPITKTFEDAVGNIIKDPFTYEEFGGSKLAANRRNEVGVFTLGILSGQRIYEFMDLSIVLGTWLDGLFDRVLTEFERLMAESYDAVASVILNMVAAVENIISEPFGFGIFQSSQTPVPDNLVGDYSLFVLGVLSGQKLVRMGYGLELVPHPEDLE
jgi:hypothetical protein